MAHTYTHTYVILEVSQATFDEIKARLEQAGYSDQIYLDRDEPVTISMHGLALRVERERNPAVRVSATPTVPHT